jgi:prepilin-type N-terminal cleavage/methylation domain-containing protein
MKQREPLRAFTLPKLRERFAFTLLSVRARSAIRNPQSAFRIPQFARHSSLVTRHAAFTLLELLVVIGIVSILLVAVIPAVTSLSKSSGRKGAISNLLGGIEQARAEAIKTGQATYVVFPTFGSSTLQTTLDRYNYKSYAIWEDDPTTTPASQKQISNWKSLPTGVAIRSKTSAPESLNNLSKDTSSMFKFTPDSSATPTFYYMKFNANGEIEFPNSSVMLAVFEGYVDTSNSEIITGAKDSFSPPNPLATEAINVSHLTGRAEPTATATPTS